MDILQNLDFFFNNSSGSLRQCCRSLHNLNLKKNQFLCFIEVMLQKSEDRLADMKNQIGSKLAFFVQIRPREEDPLTLGPAGPLAPAGPLSP